MFPWSDACSHTSTGLPCVGGPRRRWSQRKDSWRQRLLLSCCRERPCNFRGSTPPHLLSVRAPPRLSRMAVCVIGWPKFGTRCIPFGLDVQNILPTNDATCTSWRPESESNWRASWALNNWPLFPQYPIRYWKHLGLLFKAQGAHWIDDSGCVPFTSLCLLTWHSGVWHGTAEGTSNSRKSSVAIELSKIRLHTCGLAIVAKKMSLRKVSQYTTQFASGGGQHARWLWEREKLCWKGR